MVEDSREIERWHFGDRYYGVVFAGGPDCTDLELDDLGPGLGRGSIMVASYADESGEMTVRTFTEEPLPLALVEQFVIEARLRLPSSA